MVWRAAGAAHRPPLPAASQRRAPPSCTLPAGCVRRGAPGRRRRAPLPASAPAASPPWLPATPKYVFSTRLGDADTASVMRTLRALHGEGVADARLEALLDSATAWAFAWTAAGAAGDTAAAAASDAAAPASLAALLPRRPRGRRLVGLARCWGDRALVALLDDVFVEPEHRRAGVGRRLVQLLLAELRVRGIADIGVLCPASAAPFFASCAFAEDAASRLCVAAGGAGAGGEATRLVASQR